VHAFEFEGTRYDCGNKLGYLQATVEFGLKHPSLGGGFASYLKELAGRL
jgi:UTP--glucose-1-phosphate uridylyltransferase